MLRGIFTFAILMALGYSGLMLYFKGHALTQVLLMVLFATPLLMFFFDSKGNDKLRNKLEKAEDNFIKYTVVLFKIYFSRYHALFNLIFKK